MNTAYRNRLLNVKRTTTHIYLFWIAALLLACVSAVAAPESSGRYDKGLLWKIERAGVAPSYLFGTMHSDDPAIISLPGPVQQAFDRSRGVTLEVALDAQALVTMTAALLLADGTSLESIIGPELYRRTLQVMTAQGIPEMIVAGMKPWAVAVTLMTPVNENGVVLDHVLYQQAIATGKPVDGLETAAEQMALFDDLSQEDQVTLLRDTLDHLTEIQGLLVQLQDAYLARDLKRLQEINAASMQDSDPRLVETFTHKVIVERNHRMAQRMESRLSEGARFIAVGALHLPGEEGLLNLLVQRGYRVTRVY
jgi:uncharacterized protein YbaP (TraB family)